MEPRAGSTRFPRPPGVARRTGVLLAGVVAVAAGLGILAGCPSDSSRSRLDVIEERGTLRIGLQAGAKPFEWQDEDGSYRGFDIDLMRALADDLGVELEVVNQAWDGLISSLQTGRFDVISSAMTITEERAEAIDFSEPYYTTGQAFLVNSDFAAEHGLEDSADLGELFEEEDAPAFILAVQQGTTGQFAAERMFPEATLRKFQHESDCALQVKDGQAHAFMFDKDYLRYVSNRYPDSTEVLLPVVTDEEYGVAVRKGEEELLRYINAFLRRIRQDGRYETIYNRYFGDDPAWYRE